MSLRSEEKGAIINCSGMSVILGTIAMRPVKISALSNLESAITEVEFDRLLDTVRMAVDSALREEFLTHPPTFDKSAKAASDQAMGPKAMMKASCPRSVSINWNT